MNVNWQYFPQCDQVPTYLSDVIDVFNKNIKSITSEKCELRSNEVLSIIANDIKQLSFSVEEGKSKDKLVYVPVLFGRNGKPSKSFNADAFNPELGIVIEVEAGRAVSNYQFLKDIFQASVMQNVKYLVVAVRNKYREQKDFETVVSFMETLYASQRLSLPLTGILIIGY